MNRELAFQFSSSFYFLDAWMLCKLKIWVSFKRWCDMYCLHSLVLNHGWIPIKFLHLKWSYGEGDVAGYRASMERWVRWVPTEEEHIEIQYIHFSVLLCAPTGWRMWRYKSSPSMTLILQHTTSSWSVVWILAPGGAKLGGCWGIMGGLRKGAFPTLTYCLGSFQLLSSPVHPLLYS